jgi:N-acetylglucosaminyldiphosphoundecaprenol N-acetyl-beta-D-mannosaminyltransferase
MKKYEILNVPCFRVTSKDEIKNYIIKLIENKIGGYSVAINAEKIMMYSKDEEIKKIIDNSILPIPDGAGAVLGFKFLYKLYCIKVDLPRLILEIANENKYKLFILGAKEEVNKKAVENIKKLYPFIEIVGRHNGYFDDEKKIISILKNTQPQIVLVALGSPRQEKFAAKIKEFLPNTLFVGCGGALDVLAGRVKRAPTFFQENHFEWLYRLMKEPKRIKRQKVLPVFLLKLMKESMKRRVVK